MSFTGVNDIISYLRRIFRNTQMEVLNLVLVYLQNLMHADVTIHKEETDQVWFNEARSISDFNSHLMIGEIMCTSFLADWVERAGKDPVLMKVIMEPPVSETIRDNKTIFADVPGRYAVKSDNGRSFPG